MLYTYSAFLVALGSYAYLHSNSLVSLLTSLISALMITSAATLKNQAHVGYAVTAFLAFYFSLNYISSHRLFPHGLIASVSMFVLIWPLLKRIRFSLTRPEPKRSPRRARRSQ